MPKLFIATGCILAMLGVMLGAFAAHGLKSTLTPALLHTFQTGVTYQFIHAISLILVGLIMLHIKSNGMVFAGACFIVGVACFSGSLYALSLGGPAWLGPITPLGGLCFIVGWATAAVSVIKSM